MKKKILSLILALVFIPSIFMFAGCKDKGYQLVDLVKDYEKIGTKCENIKVVDNKIEFDYDVHTIGETGYLTECVNEIAPYTEIADYNILLDNLMGFVYENIDVCSNANIEAGAEIRNNLKFQLDEFANAVYELDVHINHWAKIIEFNYSSTDKTEMTNVQCLSRFKNVLTAYNNLFQKAISFSNGLADLYYNYALNDANPKVYNTSLVDFDASVIVSKLQGRVKYEISNLSQLFVEIYVDGNNLPTELTTPIVLNKGEDNETIIFKTFELNKTGFAYLDKVNNLNRIFADDFNAEQAVEKANANLNKQNFYNLAVKAFNLQNILENDNDIFVNACKKIQYNNIDNNNVYEVQCIEIVDNYKIVVEEYYGVLESMLNIIL